MPVKKKKKFIDKKNAVSFHLVHRSQKDPLQASEEASKHVLLPSSTEPKSSEDRLEEQRKYGVYFEDDYDYTQHLKDLNEVYELEEVDRVKVNAKDEVKHPKVNLPSSVFASHMESEVGLLNKAAPSSGPKIDWDPDIVAALDDDFDVDDPENELEDDFIMKANAPAKENQEDGSDEVEENSDVASDEADMSDFGSDDEEFGHDHMFMDEETKSRFTNYSMSSSVIKRNEGLTLLDDRFEKFYEQFDDSEIGALDHEDIDGALGQNSKVLSTILEEFEKQQEQTRLKDVVDAKEDASMEEEEESSDDNLVEMIIEEPKEKWDCESILSTYSNLYNHPKLIKEPTQDTKIQLTSKIGIPKDVLSAPKISRRQMEKQLHEDLKADRASTYRPKDETLEEKKARKNVVKEERKERRQEKKINKKVFSKEKLRQEKEVMNLNNNLKGVQIL